MQRRLFVRALTTGVLLAPIAGLAQQPNTHVLGILTSDTVAVETTWISSFVEGLQELGYFERRNVHLELRDAAGHFERLPALAADLVRKRVDVIVCFTSLAAQAASRATTAIPIVFTTVADPVGQGLVKSLSHAGRNITGISNVGTVLSAKLVEVLKEAFPKTSRVAVFKAPHALHAAAQLTAI